MRHVMCDATTRSTGAKAPARAGLPIRLASALTPAVQPTAEPAGMPAACLQTPSQYLTAVMTWQGRM